MQTSSQSGRGVGRFGASHRYQNKKNRLLKVCYVPATTAASFKAFFLFIILQPFTVLMRHTRQAVRAIKQFISLDVYGASAPYHLLGCQMSKYPT